MKKILYIKASPREDRSYSIKAADAFVEVYKKKNPDHEIVVINLFETDLPSFDGFVIKSKYRILHGQDHTDEEKAAWEEVEKIIENFKSADKYVFAVPMWNFHIPYRLKQYIDILVQPTYTFSYSPETGYSGLLEDKPVFISYSRGGAYLPGTGMEGYDFQTHYLELILGFIGLTDIRKVITEPTLLEGPDTAKKSNDKAISDAKELAKVF